MNNTINVAPFASDYTIRVTELGIILDSFLQYSSGRIDFLNSIVHDEDGDVVSLVSFDDLDLSEAEHQNGWYDIDELDGTKNIKFFNDGSTFKLDFGNEVEAGKFERFSFDFVVTDSQGNFTTSTFTILAFDEAYAGENLAPDVDNFTLNLSSLSAGIGGDIGHDQEARLQYLSTHALDLEGDDLRIHAINGVEYHYTDQYPDFQLHNGWSNAPEWGSIKFFDGGTFKVRTNDNIKNLEFGEVFSDTLTLTVSDTDGNMVDAEFTINFTGEEHKLGRDLDFTDEIEMDLPNYNILPVALGGHKSNKNYYQKLDGGSFAFDHQEEGSNVPERTPNSNFVVTEDGHASKLPNSYVDLSNAEAGIGSEGAFFL